MTVADQLATLRASAVEELARANDGREAGLTACRQTIRACSRSIRMVHRQEFAEALVVAEEAETALRAAQSALAPHPRIAHAGFLHDAEKEYAEARLVYSFVCREDLPSAATLGVGVPAWLNGLAEAASELRRFLLDQLRSGETGSGDALLEIMDDVYEVLVSVDYPDALTGGLRRTTDAYRAVLERTRSDYTTAVLQTRLQQALAERA